MSLHTQILFLIFYHLICQQFIDCCLHHLTQPTIVRYDSPAQG